MGQAVHGLARLRGDMQAHRRIPRGRQRRQRRRRHAERTAVLERQAHAVCAIFRQRAAHARNLAHQRVSIETEAERASGMFQPRQMPVQQRHALRARRPHRLEQRQARIERGDEARFQPALGVLVVGDAVVHDARADAEFARAQTVGASRTEHQRADRHRKARVAHGAIADWRIDPTDRTGIEATRLRLQRIDDLHGAALGCARDRAAREQRGKAVSKTGLGWYLRLHGGRHLQHAAVRRHLEQCRHAHRARARKAAEIVAQQVHDHQVFGAVLLVGGERDRACFVDFRIAAGGRGALHRPRDQAAGAMREEQLGRARQDRPTLRQPDQRAIRHRLARAQATVQRERRAERGHAQAIRVVDFVGVARSDPVLDAGDGANVGVMVNAGGTVEQTGRAAGLGPRIEQRLDLGRRQHLHRAEQQHAQAAVMAGQRRGSGCRNGRGKADQRPAERVWGHDQRVQAFGPRASQRIVQPLQPARRPDDLAGIARVPARARRAGRGGIVQQRERRAGIWRLHGDVPRLQQKRGAQLEKKFFTLSSHDCSCGLCREPPSWTDLSNWRSSSFWCSVSRTGVSITICTYRSPA